MAKIAVLRQDNPNAVIEAAISIGSATIRLLSAEVYERAGGTFEICERDETILVQLNGIRPNPALEQNDNGGDD